MRRGGARFHRKSDDQLREKGEPLCRRRTATKKYVRYEGGFEELFDLASDPYELENSVRDPANAGDLSGLRGIHDTSNPAPARAAGCLEPGKLDCW